MLRVMLGVCGAGLVALGVFGERLLDNTYQTISGVFEPDLVTEAPAVAVAATETVIVNESSSSASQAADQAVVQAATALVPATLAQADNAPADNAQDELVTTELAVSEQPRALEIETENLTEVKASARQDGLAIATAATDQAVLPKEIATEQIVQTTAGPGPNNTLYVLKDRVNLREGPSIGHPIVLELAQGQELMEFKRDGKWVHVGAYGTSGKIGWVHGTLVGKN